MSEWRRWHSKSIGAGGAELTCWATQPLKVTRLLSWFNAFLERALAKKGGAATGPALWEFDKDNRDS